MKIDISHIVRINGANEEIQFNQVLESLEGIFKSIEFDESVDFKGTLFNEGGILYLTGQLHTCYHADCFRCTKNVKKCVDITVNETIMRAGKAEDEDVYTYEDNTLDIGTIIKDNIVLSAPMKVLCGDNCKGLCDKCGKDLNEDVCSCSDDSIDPRLEVLKNFFENGDN